MDTGKMDGFDALFYAAVFDRLQTNIYILDVDTDTIVYMNEAMKEEFHLEHPEGSPCWELLQKGMTGKCPFCHIKNKTAEGRVDVWDEHNTRTGHIYRHYDSWAEWNGKFYYVSNFTDVTEYEQLSRKARTDELTGIYNRRAGQEMLAGRMVTARQENKIITMALVDVNELKKINDEYGHAEGDRLLVCMVSVMKDSLREQDMVFRLGSDEFILVFMMNYLRIRKSV